MAVAEAGAIALIGYSGHTIGYGEACARAKLVDEGRSFLGGAGARGMSLLVEYPRSA
jgi:hypothetical protein